MIHFVSKSVGRPWQTATAERSALKRGNDQDGFTLTEVLAAAVVLGATVAISTTINAMIEQKKYESSLKDAVRQVIDNDIAYIKQRLFTLNYVPAVINGNNITTSPCYKTHTSCNGSSEIKDLVQYCRNLGSNAIQFIGGSGSYLRLDKNVHAVFGSTPVSIRRDMTSVRSSFAASLTSNVDAPLIRLVYSVIGSNRNTNVGLKASSPGEILRIAELYPDSYGYCNPE